MQLRRGRRLILAAIAVAFGAGALVLTGGEESQASYPGLNGDFAFVRGLPGHEQVFSAKADRSDVVALTPGPEDAAPTYSPDGSEIAYQSAQGIEVMGADGSEPRVVAAAEESTESEDEYAENFHDPTPGSRRVIPYVKIRTSTTPFLTYGHPSFSPGGTILAASQASGVKKKTSVCAIAAPRDPTCIREVIEGGGPEPYGYVHEECKGCVSRIVTIELSTGKLLKPVTSGSPEYEDFDPSYSVDGILAFDRVEPNPNDSTATPKSRIFITEALGVAPLTSGPDDFLPDFSPDGSRVVFDRGTDEIGITLIGGATTSRAIPGAPGAISTVVKAPVFSPDGREILFARTDEFFEQLPQTAIYEQPAAGGELVAVQGYGFDPAVQPTEPTSEPELERRPLRPPFAQGSDPPPPPAPSSPSNPPQPRPAFGHAETGRLKLNRHGRAVIGTVSCGTSNCALKPFNVRLHLPNGGRSPGKPCKATFRVPKTLAAGQTAQVIAVVPARCLSAFTEAGLTASLQLAEVLGAKALQFRLTLLSPRAPAKG